MKLSPPAPTSERREFVCELKFLVPEDVAAAALVWSRAHLSPDPFAGGESGDGYCVNSVYLDTPKFDVFHRVGSFGRCKYRVRRYGTETGVFLERKLKTRGLVGKRRTRVPEDETGFLEAVEPNRDWIGFWFHRRLAARRLEPKCQIAYERVARMGTVPEGPIRMTVDRNVRAFATSEWQVKCDGPWQPVTGERFIIEIKFRTALPALFQNMVQELGIQPQPISKYRLTVQAFGWQGPESEASLQAVNGHAVPIQQNITPSLQT